MNTSAPSSPKESKQVLRQLDDSARALATDLLRNTHIGALGTLDPSDGSPLTSLCTIATDTNGSPIILISTLSAHTQALAADPRCSVLLSRPGAGDPLAHPRMTVVCRAEFLPHDSEDEQRAANRFLARHEKARLYAGFGDFQFVRLNVQRALLNGGFGKAYELDQTDLLCAQPLCDEFAQVEPGVLEHMNSDHADAVRNYATVLAQQDSGDWQLTGIDPTGIDLSCGQSICRIPFETPLTSTDAIRPALVAMAKQAKAS